MEGMGFLMPNHIYFSWSDQEGAMANLELAPDPHISRKSSSSTDSSSNYSLQSRHSTSSEAGV